MKSIYSSESMLTGEVMSGLDHRRRINPNSYALKEAFVKGKLSFDYTLWESV
jgi:hypothetical protein